MHKSRFLFSVFFSILIFSNIFIKVKAVNPLELSLFSNEFNPNINEKTKIYLLAKTGSDLQVNGILTGIRVPKSLNVSNLNLEIPTSFIFNHIEATDHGTYTQIEIMLAKKTGTSFVLKNNDPIISFDIDSSSAGTYDLDPIPSINTSILDINQTELFEKYNPSILSINVIDNTLQPSPTPIVPTPTPIIPTPSPTVIPTVVVPTPTPSPTVVIPTPSPSPTPYTPNTFNIPTKIEAEDFNKNDSDNNFSIVENSSASNGARIGYIKKDSFAVYNISNTTTKKFDITFSYSSFDDTIPNKSLSLYKITSGVEEFLGTLDIENTNGWDLYKQASLKELQIDSNTSQLKIVFNTDYFDLDYLDVKESVIPSPTPTPIIPTPSPTPIVPTPTPTPVVPTPSPTPTVVIPTPSPTIVPTIEIPTPTPTTTVIPSPTPVVPTPTPIIPTPTISVPTPTITPTVIPSPTSSFFQLTNLKVKSNERYIHVIKGLVDRNRIYTDRWYKFRYIPQALYGLDYIRTANDDKRSTGKDFLTFEINKKSEIYIAHDARIKNKPDWLKSFTNTGLTIKGDFGMNFTVYKKVFDAGKVTLGGNQEGRYKRYEVSNYFVIIKPLSQ